MYNGINALGGPHTWEGILVSLYFILLVILGNCILFVAIYVSWSLESLHLKFGSKSQSSVPLQQNLLNFRAVSLGLSLQTEMIIARRNYPPNSCFGFSMPTRRSFLRILNIRASAGR